MTIKKIGIIGSREWTDRGCIERFLGLIDKGVAVVSGGQTLGVDGWVREAAISNGLDYLEYPPEHNHSNGHTARVCPITGDRIRYNQKFSDLNYHNRNRRIARDCDIVVAFWSGEHSKGRESTIRACEEFGKPYVIFGRTKIDVFGLNGSKRSFEGLIKGHSLDEFLPTSIYMSTPDV